MDSTVTTWEYFVVWGGIFVFMSLVYFVGPVLDVLSLWRLQVKHRKKRQKKDYENVDDSYGI
jgi:uncharacterized membrane protein